MDVRFPPAPPPARADTPDDGCVAAVRAFRRRQTLDLALHYDLMGLHEEAERAIRSLDFWEEPVG